MSKGVQNTFSTKHYSYKMRLFLSDQRIVLINEGTKLSVAAFFTKGGD